MLSAAHSSLLLLLHMKFEEGTHFQVCSNCSHVVTKAENSKVFGCYRLFNMIAFETSSMPDVYLEPPRYAATATTIW